MSMSKRELAAKNLKTIENYNNALTTVRKRHADQVKNQTINSKGNTPGCG